jgi:DNA invertase Pin-like site-specific DNA recombinase
VSTDAAQAEAIVRLESLGRRRGRLADQLAKVEEELLDDAIPAAARAGVPKLRIANAAGVVRQTVYNVLAREEART